MIRLLTGMAMVWNLWYFMKWENVWKQPADVENSKLMCENRISLFKQNGQSYCRLI